MMLAVGGIKKHMVGLTQPNYLEYIMYFMYSQWSNILTFALISALILRAE